MSKINKVLAKWIPGDIHSLRWFEEHQIGQRVAYGYAETGALHRIGTGVFALPEDELSWLGAIRVMQSELNLPIHVGGRTALELHGTSHHIVRARRPIVSVISSKKINVPTWCKKNDWNADLSFKQSSLIYGEQVLSDFTADRLSIKIAAREQAILELIDTLDLSRSFETAENYLSTLMTLRPVVVQDLLTRCSSIKVKRVFLYLSESMELPFFSKLNLNKIELGVGKRVIVKDGRFDSKYQITVPKNDREETVGV